MYTRNSRDDRLKERDFIAARVRFIGRHSYLWKLHIIVTPTHEAVTAGLVYIYAHN